MDISRRFFIGGLASAMVLGSRRLFSASQDAFAGGKPALTFGLLSDIHIALDPGGRQLNPKYGTDTLEIHKDAILPDDIVVIHDDLLATGGTMLAAYELVKSMNPKKVYINVICDLADLHGREVFPPDVDVTTLFTF